MLVRVFDLFFAHYSSNQRFLFELSVAVLTQSGGIASTMGGTGCNPDFDVYSQDNCTLVVENTFEDEDGTTTTVTQSESCEAILKEDIPGSNLYFFSWFALLASVNITLRWKAAQALQFAQAAQGRATGANKAELGSSNHSDNSGEFEDAVEDDEDAI